LARFGAALLSDTAVITGGYKVTGIIIFTLTAPDHTTQTQLVNVSGAGSYSSLAVLATQVGTYTALGINGRGHNKGCDFLL
jgi:hypothetical protein